MAFIDRRYVRCFDWISFAIILVLLSLSLTFIFSATYKPDQPYSLFFKKQLFGICSGLVIYFFCCFADYRTLERAGYFLYFATLGLLAITILKGSIGMGAQRWISLGIIKFQPSELAKLFFPPFFSYYLYTENDTFASSLKSILPVLGILLLSFLLIRKQPDLGTALIILFSGILMLWLAGIIHKRFFICSFFLCIITAPLLWKCLKPYQRHRIEVFLGSGDKRKERYQIEQSRIAIGSGGIYGKGFLRGTQNKLKFLPESRTDFIFSVVAEEWGFIGTLTLMALYLCLFIRLAFVICSIKNFFVQVLASGLILPMVISTLINISMVLGLMPVVGIPLPLMSYGISHTWITLASLGWFNSIAMRRFYLSMNSSNKII